ncbi:hypothetical protein GCM10017687_33900 [Streptomyces echinatus]
MDAEPSCVTVIALPLPWSPARRSDSRPLSNSGFYGAPAPGTKPLPSGGPGRHTRPVGPADTTGPPCPVGTTGPVGSAAPPAPGDGGRRAVRVRAGCGAPGPAGGPAQYSQAASNARTSAETACANRSRSGTARASATRP